ncbi:NAD-dependent epimerase/dehydratase family protein [Marinococcus halotolerans]|uniref:NAD-dependent epimerase/dehydratase family protein n=1 Tax=Marinococcus halotolerans TaxID=301092 RepID=UPI0003B31E86|nr:NAD(P)-dependent oxidoreductase [Marinococcus halotolerans]
MKKVLLTGAAGTIGTVLRSYLSKRFDIVLTDAKAPEDLTSEETFMEADITNKAEVRELMHGVDAVIHLGGIPVEVDFESIEQVNITGTFHVMEAAAEAGVERLIFASSIHAVGFYPADEWVDEASPVRPDTLYGVSKAYGEALGRYYHDKFGLKGIGVRICNFQDRPASEHDLENWFSPRDAERLFEAALTCALPEYLIVYGISNNTRAKFKNTRAKEIGYEPGENAEDYAGEVEAGSHPKKGGDFTAKDFGKENGR